MYMDHLHYAQNGFIPYEHVVDNVWLNVLQNYSPLRADYGVERESYSRPYTSNHDNKQGNASVKSTDIREMVNQCIHSRMCYG